MATPYQPAIEGEKQPQQMQDRVPPPPTYSMDFIQHEGPQHEQSMVYQPQEPPVAAASQPVYEPGPRMVTPLTRLGEAPAEVDCPYCRTVVRTNVHDVSTDDSGMIQCLICLVCWPMLLCYRSNKDTNHHCSVCQRQLTHRPYGGKVTVVAAPNPEPAVVPSQYEQARMRSQGESAGGV